jgi:hypothetical protein
MIDKRLLLLYTDASIIIFVLYNFVKSISYEHLLFLSSIYLIMIASNILRVKTEWCLQLADDVRRPAVFIT